MLSFSLAVVYTVRGDGFATLSFSSISHLQRKEGHCISQGEWNFGKSLIKLPTAGSMSAAVMVFPSHNTICLRCTLYIQCT